MISLWFLHGTGILMMTEVLNMVKKALADKKYKVNGETVRANLELSLQGKAQAMFHKALNETTGDEAENIPAEGRYKSLIVPRLGPWDAGNWQPDT